MTQEKFVDKDSLIDTEMTINDLSQRFLDSKLEQAISEIDVPEVEMKLGGFTMEFNLEKLNFVFRLDDFSGRILVLGFYATLVGVLSGLYHLIF